MDAGAWCLSWGPHDALGCRNAEGSHPNEDRHQAPTFPHVRPLSLQALSLTLFGEWPVHGRSFWRSGASMIFNIQGR